MTAQSGAPQLFLCDQNKQRLRVSVSMRAEEIIVNNQAVGTGTVLLATGRAADTVGDELEGKPKKKSRCTSGGMTNVNLGASICVPPLQVAVNGSSFFKQQWHYFFFVYFVFFPHISSISHLP